MSQISSQSSDTEQLREKHYNATVTQIQRVTEGLIILRVRPDEGPPEFKAGQYTVLGLGAWEPYVPNAASAASVASGRRVDDVDHSRLLRRAYSISCRLFADDGRLVRPGEDGDLEFYIALVQKPDRAAALTPRLFLLEAGDRLHVGPSCRGRYTLERVSDPASTIVFMATGYGEAPHNAMISELLWRKYAGSIISVVCTRRSADLAYLDRHRTLEQKFGHYRYLTLTTREPHNVDCSDPCYVGKRYIQDYFASEDLEADAGVKLNPSNTHVFLCGSPDMIGLPVHTHGEPTRYPEPTGMVELLEKRGFRIDQARESGNIHVESYW